MPSSDASARSAAVTGHYIGDTREASLDGIVSPVCSGRSPHIHTGRGKMVPRITAVLTRVKTDWAAQELPVHDQTRQELRWQLVQREL